MLRAAKRMGGRESFLNAPGKQTDHTGGKRLPTGIRGDFTERSNILASITYCLQIIKVIHYTYKVLLSNAKQPEASTKMCDLFFVAIYPYYRNTIWQYHKRLGLLHIKQ